MNEEIDNIDIRQLISGTTNDDGSKRDYSVIEEENEKEIGDIQDDDAPIDDPNIDVVMEVIKRIYTRPYIDKISKHGRLGCSYHMPKFYNKGATLQEFRASVGSNHLGSINSSILNGLSGRLSEILEEDGCKYVPMDGDRIDWKMEDTHGKIEVMGDTKMALSRSSILKCFTGNGSSNKQGYYLLIAIRFDDLVPMKETEITHMYVGVIPVRYVSNVRADGKSDRTSINIKMNLQHRLKSIFGSTITSNRKNTKWLKFRLAPVGNFVGDGFFEGGDE